VYIRAKTQVFALFVCGGVWGGVYRDDRRYDAEELRYSAGTEMIGRRAYNMIEYEL